MNEPSASENFRRILGRVGRQAFVGRGEELQRVLAQANPLAAKRGLLVLLEPLAGVSELLRQAYDEIFNRRSDIIPIYFAFTKNEGTAVSAAIEFLNSFLQQYVAYRRDEPSLCHASLTLPDLVELATPTDREWVEQLVEGYTRQRFSNDDKALVRFCLSAPQRVPARHGRPFVMLDGAQLAEHLNGAVTLGIEVLRVFCRSGLSFVLAGLRRQILDAAHEARCDLESLDTLRLEQLRVEDARQLVEQVALRLQVATTEETRDLLVQQFAGSPFFLTAFLRAAREKNAKLTSYLDCERLYVDELLGGYIHRHFADLLDEISDAADARKALIRILWEASVSDVQIASLEAWGKQLHLGAKELSDVLHRLHVQEFVNWDGAIVEAGGGPLAWKDYLKVRYRLDVLNEARALVVAEALTGSLKRAPHTMARHYKNVSRLSLRELLARFDCQRVPKSLFAYEEFSRSYKGANEKEVTSRLDSDTDLVRLPQIVHVSSSVAFNSDMRQVCIEDRCVVAHGFEDATYTDGHETIWLVAEVESKLEVEAELVMVWLDRLEMLAKFSGFRRHQIWLISVEGFSSDAIKLLGHRGAFASSRQQVELLAARLGEKRISPVAGSQHPDEFLMVLPMGDDSELIAASTVEQIARRFSFRPEAINQIKTAVVEACINAEEHSLSPDRKIYQRFRFEDDRLVVTISSRGLVPTNVGNGEGANAGNSTSEESSEERRGWGLKLIRTLMDEVEFERVDEGTSLRMTKYLRRSSS